MFQRTSARPVRQLIASCAVVVTVFTGTMMPAVASTPSKTTYSAMQSATGDAGSSLYSVSCAAPGDCTAVGNSASGTPIAVSSINGKWSTPVAISFGSVGQYSIPSSTGFAVSCATPGNCTAVGSFRDALGGTEAMSFTSTNGTWGNVQPTTYVAGVNQAQTSAGFNSIVCSAPGTCTAVGHFDEPGVGLVAMTDSSVGGLWSPAAAATFAIGVQSTSTMAAFFSVSCPRAGDCTAAGQFLDAGGNVEAMTATSTNGEWGTVVPATYASGVQNATPSAYFAAVSCSAPGSCTAAGSFLDANGNTSAMTESSVNGSWSAAVPSNVFSVTHTTHPKATFTSVSCTSVGTCTAVGSYEDSTQGNQAFTQSSTNGTWAPSVAAKIAAGVQSTSPNDKFTAVSCSKVGDCTAVGRLAANQGGQWVYDPMVATSTNGVWGQVVVTSLASLSSVANGIGFNGVSCTSPGNCAMVGDEFLAPSSTTAAIQTMTTIQTPSPPLKVRARATGTHVSVTWAAPASNGGVTSMRFLVVATPGKRSCTTTALHCVIKGLKVTSRYSITVTAENSVGHGPVSAKVIVKG